MDTTLVFFVLGGVTSCEVSAIQDAMDSTGMSNYGDVMIGSTSLLTDGRNDVWNELFV